MSSARISGHKGAVEVLPSTAAAHRGSDPGAGFAAALGALAARFAPGSGDPSDGSGDGSIGGDQSADGSKTAIGTDPGKASDTTGGAGDSGDAPSIATLPGLGAWFAGSGDGATPEAPISSGGHRSGRHGATAGEVAVTAAAAAAIAAAALAGPAPQPATSTAAVSSTGAQAAAAGQPVLAAAQLTQSGFTRPAAPLVGRPGGTSSDPAPVADGVAGVAGAPATAVHAARAGHGSSPPTADRAVRSLAAAASPQVPGFPTTNLSSPATAADPAVAPAVQATANPAPAVQVQVGAATVAAATAVAAMVNPAAPPDSSRSGGRDFADTARDGQAAAAAAFSGLAAAGTAGGPAAPSADAGGVSGPGLGGDAGAANVAAQLSGQVLRLLQNSGHEAVVRLYPPDLGEVTVRVAISGRDVTAWFGSPQPAVQQSISAGLGQLQTDLGNAGYSLNNAWVGADASGFGARGDTPPPPAPVVPPTLVTPTLAAPIGPVSAGLSSNSGVSIYV
ncbi:MAG TPA: flagellar hook-length control protein FliK [Stellaceae bacterium]|jgi:flagellar hook-length control protein FliK